GLTVHDAVDLATAAEDVLDTAALSDRRVHPTLEPAVISGDPVLIERLVANLVDNAVRYNTADGDIWVSSRTVAGKSHLTVTNTGPLSVRRTPTASSSPSSGSTTAPPKRASDSASPSWRPSPQFMVAPPARAPALTAAW